MTKKRELRRPAAALSDEESFDDDETDAILPQTLANPSAAAKMGRKPQMKVAAKKTTKPSTKRSPRKGATTLGDNLGKKPGAEKKPGAPSADAPRTSPRKKAGKTGEAAGEKPGAVSAIVPDSSSRKKAGKAGEAPTTYMRKHPNPTSNTDSRKRLKTSLNSASNRLPVISIPSLPEPPTREPQVPDEPEKVMDMGQSHTALARMFDMSCVRSSSPDNPLLRGA